MVILTNEYLPSKATRLLRRCVRCKQEQWLGCFANRYARRCNDCLHERNQNKCLSCGDPAGWTTSSALRKFCVKPECQEAREEDRRQRGVETRRRNYREKMLHRKTWRCAVCAELKPLDFEHFAPHKRDENGTILRFDSYCRSCRAVDQRLRYAENEERRLRHRERYRQKYAAIRARRDVDPEFDQQCREESRLSSQRSRARRREREAIEAAPTPQSSGSGPEMPAGPLMAAIDAWIAAEDISEVAAAQRMGTTDRRFRDWRRPGAKTRLSIADGCLVAMDLLWFDIWDPVEYPEVARIWESD